jgi:hypothetical protein
MKIGDANARLSTEFNPFTEEYLGEIIEAVALAWARMKQPRTSEWEDDITFRLAGRLMNDPTFRDLPYDVVPQYWLLGLNGERLGRLDLRFKHRSSQQDYLAFEAKRLHVTFPGGKFSLEHSVYAGDDGMGAFIAGQYSKGLAAAGMLAYVMDGNTDRAWVGLAAHIETKREELRLQKPAKFGESELNHHIKPGLPGTRLGETQHDLVSHVLRLLHLLLPVRPSSGASGLNCRDV